MKPASRCSTRSICIAVAALTLLISAAISHAQPLTKSQQKCVNTLNKAAAKVDKTAGKQISTCLKAHARGKPFNANDPSIDLLEECVTDDPKGKLQKSTDKTTSDYGKQCTPPPAGKLSDPFPPFAATDAMTVNGAATQASRNLIHGVFGPDLDAPGLMETFAADIDAAKCQEGVWKAMTRCRETRLKEFNKCKKAALGDPSVVDSMSLETTCLMQDADPATDQPDDKGKIGKACAAPAGGIDKALAKCGAVDLDGALPGCASSLDKTACLDRQIQCHVCEALNAADGLARDCDLFDNGITDSSCGGSSCGNGTLDAGEFCDDGNQSNGDGCSDACQLESTCPCWTAASLDGLFPPGHFLAAGRLGPQCRDAIGNRGVTSVDTCFDPSFGTDLVRSGALMGHSPNPNGCSYAVDQDPTNSGFCDGSSTLILTTFPEAVACYWEMTHSNMWQTECGS